MTGRNGKARPMWRKATSTRHIMSSTSGPVVAATVHVVGRARADIHENTEPRDSMTTDTAEQF